MVVPAVSVTAPDDPPPVSPVPAMTWVIVPALPEAQIGDVAAPRDCRNWPLVPADPEPSATVDEIIRFPFSVVALDTVILDVTIDVLTFRPSDPSMVSELPM